MCRKCETHLAIVRRLRPFADRVHVVTDLVAKFSSYFAHVLEAEEESVGRRWHGYLAQDTETAKSPNEAN